MRVGSLFSLKPANHDRVCSECAEPRLARGLCRKHYDEWRGPRRRSRHPAPAIRRDQNLRARYRLGAADVAAMLATQGGCGICGRTESTRWCVDHDHATGRVRGVLCHPCNVALPAVENVDYREAALRWLAR